MCKSKCKNNLPKLVAKILLMTHFRSKTNSNATKIELAI